MSSSVCCVCSGSLEFVRTTIGDKSYCSTCAGNLPMVCTDCKLERQRKHFPEWGDRCWTCKLKRLNEYEELICPKIMATFAKFKVRNPCYRDAKVLGTEEFQLLLVELARPEFKF